MTTQRDGWETLGFVLGNFLAGIAGVAYWVHGMTFEQAVVTLLLALVLFQR